MAFMTAVFSYNRGQLLANCVRSIELFSPSECVVVFDDSSDDPSTIEALRDLEQRGHEVHVNERASDNRHGNWYENLARSADMARQRGYELLQIVEDDMQFVWRNDELEAEVASLFEAFPLLGEVNVMFWKYVTKAHGMLVDGFQAYRGGLGPSCHTGFVNVRRLAAVGFEYQSDEASCRAAAAACGLHALSLAVPVVTRVPWPIYARHRSVKGRRVKSHRPLLIKPLDDAAIARLKGRDLARMPYSEDWCVPWGWRCWKPYHWTASRRDWLKAIAIVARRRRSLRGLLPRRTGEL
jgi:glycosyltransferase involved in cell wall biosynthesis